MDYKHDFVSGGGLGYWGIGVLGLKQVMPKFHNTLIP